MLCVSCGDVYSVVIVGKNNKGLSRYWYERTIKIVVEVKGLGTVWLGN